MSLLDKLSKNSTLGNSGVFSQSDLLKNNASYSTKLKVLNVAFSGSMNGGFGSGLTQFAGPSKHFKTMLMLLCASAFLRDEPEGVVVFYDNEFGASTDYFESLGIDTDRVFHVPFMHIEDLKFDMVKKLEAFDRKDKVMIIVDSIGNAASKKEVEDAKDEKSVADMTRAKAIKSLWRIVTPYLTMKDIPCIVVNHTYSETGMFAKTVVSGGCVVEGTKIKTPTGLKAVEDFKPGDTVLTLKGEKEVTHIWNPDTLEEGNPECYEIEFSDGYTVTCSASHKFLLAKDKWVEAKDLTENMFIDILLTDSRKIRSSLKVKSVKNVGRKNVYDLSVQEVEHYVLENGVVTHNTGIMYSSNNVFIIGRAQVKEGRDVVGYDFKINIEKSRGCREKSVLPFTVTFDGGINEYAGLFDLARELGYIKMPSSGWYSRVINGEMEDRKWRKAEAEFNEEFWEDLLNSDFDKAVQSRFKLVNKGTEEEDDIDLDIEV